MEVELDLSNYATKADLKDATGVDTTKFAEKVDLASLKSNGDKLDIDKLKSEPTNLSNLKSKVDKLDVDKLVPVPVDLSKLNVYNLYIYNYSLGSCNTLVSTVEHSMYIIWIEIGLWNPKV